MNIIISHVYSSDNKGDAALTSVLIDDLKRRFPTADLRIVKLESIKKGQMFEGVPEYPAFMHYALNKYRHPLVKLAYVLYMLPATLLWAWWLHRTGQQLFLPRELRNVANMYAQADLVVAVGGGYIRSRRGLANRFNIPLLLHPLLFGYILGKPTVLYSQSVGPFMNAYEPHLVAFVLKRMTTIIVREDKSKQLLAGMGVTRNVVRSVDSGFLLTGKGAIDVRKKYHIPQNTLLLGVTVRSWLQGEAQTNYERAVAAALDAMSKQYKVYILFIPQVTAIKGDDDRVTSRRVQSFMACPATVINEEPDHHEIKALYDQLDILLGTRFHSVIFSLTSYVPVVAIEYEHKTSGIMHDLQLDEWVIAIEEVTADKLLTLLRQLIEQRQAYRQHLQTHLPPYIEQAKKTVDLVAEAAEQPQVQAITE